MSREVKRVALDFNWPLNKIWRGYLNPHYEHCGDCPDCGRTGYSVQAKRFQDEWYGYVPFDPRSTGSKPFGAEHPLVVEFATTNILFDFDTRKFREKSPYSDYLIRTEAERLAEMWDKQWSHHLAQADVDALIAGGRLFEFTRLPRTDEQKREHEAQRAAGGGYWMKEWNGYTPTAVEVNEWSIKRGFGHDGINCWLCISARCKRERVPRKCKTCRGSGERWTSPEAKALAGAWKQEEPPAGDGWQMWETTSEGSPISPVFRTPEELAGWLANTKANAGGYRGATYEQWLAMIRKGWAPSAVSVNGEYVSGVEAVADVLPSKE